MTKCKANKSELQDVLQLIENIDKIDIENDDLANSKPVSPYTIGKRPEPETWEDKGLEHKLL